MILHHPSFDLVLLGRHVVRILTLPLRGHVVSPPVPCHLQLLRTFESTWTVGTKNFKQVALAGGSFLFSKHQYGARGRGLRAVEVWICFPDRGLSVYWNSG